MSSLLVVLLYAVACIGLGALVLRLCVPAPASSTLAFDFGLGSTILASGWILFALAGFLVSWVLWLLIVPLALVGLASITLKLLKVPYGSLRHRSSIIFFGAVVLIAVVQFWYGILAFYRPPFGDADAFYMTYPKIIAHTGRLMAMGFVYHDFSTIGLSGEMHFAALMAMVSPAAAKLFAWVAGLGTLALIVEITGLAGGGRWAKLLAASAFSTSTTITDYLSDGKTDIFSALIALTAVALLMKWQKAIFKPSGGLLLGVLAGTMAYAKFSYILCMFPTIFVLAVFAAIANRRSPGRFVVDLVLMGIGTLVGLLPHLLKNGLLFGNPAAPFLGMSSNWADQGHWYSAADTAWIMATLPVSLVFGQYLLMGGTLSVIWLSALPFAVFARPQKRLVESPLLTLTISAVIGLLCWLALKASVFSPRYFLANLLLLMPIAFIGIEHYAASRRRSLVVLGGFSVLTAAVLGAAPFVLPAGVWTATPQKLYRYVADGKPTCGLSISDYCTIFQEVNASVPQGKRILLLGYYSYWLSDRLLENLNTNDENLEISGMPPDPWTKLAEMGFGAVAVQTATHGRFLDYLRRAPVPDNISIEEKFPQSNMPVFFIRTKPEAN